MRAKLLCLLALATATTAGAASAQPAGSSEQRPREVVPLTAGPVPVFAVIGHHVVSGVLRPGDTLMALADARQPAFSCALDTRDPQTISFTEVTLDCSDGATATVRLDRSGCGRSWRGERATMCIGYPPKYAARKLAPPAGKALQVDGEELVLEPVAGD